LRAANAPAREKSGFITKGASMKKSILGCAVGVALVNASNAMAGGLWLNEYGDFAGGRASAGASAGTDDAATIMHNPASATRIEGRQLFVSVGALIPEVKFDVDSSTPRNGYGNGGNAGEAAPGGSMAYIHDFGSDKWSGGVYLGGLSGAGLKYDKDWAGRYENTEVTLLLMSLAPTVAYQLTDKLSVGASVQYWYSTLDLRVAVARANSAAEDARAKIDGDDDGFGFTAGVMYELTNRTRFGISYQSELSPKYDGDLKLRIPEGPVSPGEELKVSSNTELDMAQKVRASMHHDLDEHWAVHFTIGWDDWSTLDNVFISVQRGTVPVPTKWRDTYHYAWGAQYKLNHNWTLTSGISYDTNPVDKEDRAADLPVDRQVRVAFGARYAVKDSLTVGGYINYADLGKARIANDKDDFSGDYKNNSLLGISVNANWRF
jgi:long-chain fatty acid transport protein